MPLPVLPPEDFMDTADFQRAKAARLRRLRPALLGLLALLSLAIFGLVAWWSSLSALTPSPRSDDQPGAVRPLAPPGVPQAALASSAPATSVPPAKSSTAVAPLPHSATEPVHELEPRPISTGFGDSAKPKPKTIPDVESGQSTPPLIRPTPTLRPKSDPTPVKPAASPKPEPPPGDDDLWTKQR